MKSIAFILGTRPEIIKLAPLIRRAQQAGVPFSIIHSGQHYDHALDGVFFEELKLPAPTHHLHAAAATQAQFFAAVFTGLDQIFAKEKPSVVVVQGDTNTAFAGGFVASIHSIPVAHVEAGLRSDDWTMPEERNRVLLDHLASRLYVPTEQQMDRVTSEGIDASKMLLTGNTVLDAVTEHLPLAETQTIPVAFADAAAGKYAVLTLHRPALVDHADRLHAMLQAIDALAAAQHMRVLFLVHPRTRAMLGDASYPSIILHEPIGYLPMLKLLTHAAIILTDSGGLQEEAAILRRPCVTLRENTERPETVASGGNRIVGFDHAKLTAAVTELLALSLHWKPLYAVEHPADVMFDDLRTRYL